MITVDTSTWIAYLQGDVGPDTHLLDQALQDRQVLMVPVVLAEVMSDPKLPSAVADLLLQLPLMEIGPGYWERAGRLRAQVLARKRKARLGDALIAQSCIDHAIPLLTRDHDFRAFATAAGLNILAGDHARIRKANPTERTGRGRLAVELLRGSADFRMSTDEIMALTRGTGRRRR